MDLPNILGLLAISLAVFTVGLQYMPPTVVYRLFKGKRTLLQGDIVMTKRLMALIGIVGFCGIYISLGLLIAYFASPIINKIIYLTNFPPNIEMQRPFWIIIIAVISVLIIWLIMRYLWNRAMASFIKNPQDTSDSGKLSDTLMDINKTLIKINSIYTKENELDIGNINKQYRDWLKGDDIHAKKEDKKSNENK